MFSIAEVARAADVPERRVTDLVQSAQIDCRERLVSQDDAIRLVRALTGGAQDVLGDRPTISAPAQRRRRGGLSLVGSGVLHAAFLGLLALITSLGWMATRDTDQTLKNQPPVHLVFLMEPGPGGGGGGGGTQTPAPPPPAERKAPVMIARASPVPPVRKIVPPPRPIIAPPPPPVMPPRVEPPKIQVPPPPPPQVVNAPVVPVPADPVDRVGALAAPPAPATTSNGSGAGGGIGTGAGSGLGEGEGSGIGPGTGGGTGGGPFQPGNGIDPPTLLKEVKPAYTDEARRRSIEGSVVLEIVVRADGSVGNVRVVHTLAGGLDQRAVDAVRQWRFSPARHHGSAVDVLVEVSVGFSLRTP
jgi:TonB family protein